MIHIGVGTRDRGSFIHSSVLTYTIGSPEKRYSFVGIVLVIVNEVRLYDVLVLLMLEMDISCNAVI